MATRKDTAPTGAPSPSSLFPLLQRIMELQAKAPDPTEAEKAELYRLETEWSNHWLTDGHDIPSRAAEGINERDLLDLVDDERVQLGSILGSLRCLEAAMQAQTPPACDEIEGAVALAREELRNVIDRLDEANLLRAARKPQWAPETAEELQS